MPEETHTAKDSQGNEGFYDPISKQAYINGILYKIFTIEGEGINGCQVTSQLCTPHTKDVVLDYITVDDVRYDVRYIADLAFSNCEAVESIVLGDKVEEIGWGAFRFCPNLKKFVSGSSVGFIPESCFTGDDALADVELGDQITDFQDASFNSCSALEEITLPKRLNHIGECAFNGCSSLKKITLPEGVYSIPHSAFACCGSLRELTIGASRWFDICDDALSWCHNLKTVYSNIRREKIKVFDYKKSVGLSSPTHHEDGVQPWDYQNATFVYTGKDEDEEEHGIAYKANGDE